MTDPNLLQICVTAFLAVVLLLSLLAGVIRLLVATFPVTEQPTGPDAAVLAAIHTAAAALHPGARVTNIEEIR
jgi:hypothetical protein